MRANWVRKHQKHYGVHSCDSCGAFICCSECEFDDLEDPAESFRCSYCEHTFCVRCVYDIPRDMCAGPIHQSDSEEGASASGEDEIDEEGRDRPKDNEILAYVVTKLGGKRPLDDPSSDASKKPKTGE